MTTRWFVEVDTSGMVFHQIERSGEDIAEFVPPPSWMEVTDHAQRGPSPDSLLGALVLSNGAFQLEVPQVKAPKPGVFTEQILTELAAIKATVEALAKAQKV